MGARLGRAVGHGAEVADRVRVPRLGAAGVAGQPGLRPVEGAAVEVGELVERVVAGEFTSFFDPALRQSLLEFLHTCFRYLRAAVEV